MRQYLSLALFASGLTAQTDLAERYRALAEPLFITGDRPRPSGNSSALSLRRAQTGMEPTPPELVMLVDSAIRAHLSEVQKPDSEGVRRAIESIQGKLSGNNRELARGLPQALDFRLDGQDVVVAAFAILRGSVAIERPEPHVHVYRHAPGGWELAVQLPVDFDEHAVQVQAVPSPLTNEVWLLVWGKRYGDTGARVRARLYALGQGEARTLWGRDDLNRGALEVQGNRIVLTHYDAEALRTGTPIREELFVTPAGLQ